MSQSINARYCGHQKLRRTALAIGLGLGLASWGVSAQQTTGSIYGQVPVAAGETITVSNAAGVNRTVAVDQNGRYNVSSLPVNSSYTVNLVRDGKIFSSRANVSLLVGSAVEVSFADAPNTKQLDTVVVSASAIPPIDVKAVDSRTVVTAAQLAILPLARTAEAIALLAPGATEGSGYFKGANGNALVSFGGSSVTENAYYINGFNVTDPLSGFGGTGLPYGAIDQVQVLTGGYDAAYGRSAGGVINLVGKSGTNDWHLVYSTGRRNTFDRGVYGTTCRMDEEVDGAGSDAFARCTVSMP